MKKLITLKVFFAPKVTLYKLSKENNRTTKHGSNKDSSYLRFPYLG